MPEEKIEISDEEKKLIGAALGHPVMADLDEKVVKVRRDLMIFSFITIIFCYMHTKLKITGFSFLGLQINASDPEDTEKLINIAISSLLIIIIYKLVYFSIHCWEYYRRYKIRLSGTFYHRIGAPAFDQYEYGQNEILAKDEPYTPTLYKWWLYRKDNFISQQEVLLKNLSILENTIHTNQTHVALFNSIQNNQREIKIILLEMHSALQRFDDGYKNFELNQVLRISVIEILLPILIAIYSIYQSFHLLLG